MIVTWAFGATSDELPWIEGEWVYQHYIRIWRDQRYRCISAHVTVKGAIVTHRGKTWESTIKANVWEPGVYGWVVVEG